jgi:hypothetical protein
MPMSNKELDRTYRRTYRRLITGIFVVYGMALLAILSLLIGNANVADWLSEATQAEVAATVGPPPPQPMRIAQPARTVKDD